MPETRPSGDLLRELLATDTISPASRAVLILHFEENLSLPEVAAILDIPLGTAKSRLGYGLRSIRNDLKASWRLTWPMTTKKCFADHSTRSIATETDC